jgi:hypothetical protein
VLSGRSGVDVRAAIEHVRRKTTDHHQSPLILEPAGRCCWRGRCRYGQRSGSVSGAKQRQLRSASNCAAVAWSASASPPGRCRANAPPRCRFGRSTTGGRACPSSFRLQDKDCGQNGSAPLEGVGDLLHVRARGRARAVGK